MVAIIVWNCRECCTRVDNALHRHYINISSDQVTPNMLLKIAMQPDFEHSISQLEAEFSEVRVPSAMKCDLTKVASCEGVQCVQALAKLNKELKTHKHSSQGIKASSADSLADASKLLHQLLGSA
jgi:hypothetical protein